MDYTGHYLSSLGGITLASDGERLTGLWFDGQKYFGSTLCREREEKNLPVFEEAGRWLDLYFAGQEPPFTPPLFLRGTVFQRAVWERLLCIPYGETTSYGSIAASLAKEQGRESMSAQAVGSAVGHNPISLIVPCHRVLGADGSLTGYAGGIEKKKCLLKLEQKGRKAEGL